MPGIKIASFSLPEYFMKRDREYPPSARMQMNAASLLARVNRLMERLQIPSPRYVSSGYRPGPYNRAAGGATHSGHLDGRAIDIADRDGSLAMAILSSGGEALLAACGLWMESPQATVGWVHLDILERPGHRIFGVQHKMAAVVEADDNNSVA